MWTQGYNSEFKAKNSKTSLIYINKMTRGQLKLNWYNLTGSDYSWTIWRPDKFNRLFEPCVQPMYKTMTASLSRVLTPLKVTRGSKSSLGPDFNPPEQKIGQVYMVLQLSSFPLLNIYWLCLPSHSLIFFFFFPKKTWSLWKVMKMWFNSVNTLSTHHMPNIELCFGAIMA